MKKNKKYGLKQRDRVSQDADQESMRALVQEIALLQYQGAAVAEDAHKTIIATLAATMRFLTPRLRRLRRLKGRLRDRFVEQTGKRLKWPAIPPGCL